MNAVIEQELNQQHKVKTIYEENYERQVNSLLEYRANCDRLLGWIDHNMAKLDGLEWEQCHIYGTVTLKARLSYGDQVKDPREIARRFPGLLWRKVKNPNTCGVVDWETVSDDPAIKLRITNAETYSFKECEVVI